MIRSSLESKLYILSGTRLALQTAVLLAVTAPQMATSPKAKSQRWLLILAGLAILALLAYRFRAATFDWSLFWRTFGQVDWSWLALAISLILLGNVGRALRWQVMLRPSGREVGLWKLTSDTSIGLAAVALLGRVGEVVRPYRIAASAGLPLSSQAAAWLQERMLDLLAVLLLFGMALIEVPARAAHLSPQLRRSLAAGGFVFAGIAALCLALFVIFRSFSGWGQRRILAALAFLAEHHQRRAERLLEAFSQGLESARNGRLFVQLLAYTALEWAIILTSLYAMLQAFPATARLGYLDAVVLVGLMAFGGLLQIPGIGGGVQVAYIVGFTQIYGIPLAAATGVAVLLWATHFAAIVPFGLACAFHEGLNWSKLKLLSTKQILDDPR